jgi:hypothetical protein
MIKCEFCDYTTNKKSNLTRHIKTRHKKIKNLKCEFCDYITDKKSNLTRHIKTRHENLKNLKCEFCDYITDKKVNLTRHIKTKHENLKCEFCDYVGQRKYNLDRHVKLVHLNKKPSCKVVRISYNELRESYDDLLKEFNDYKNNFNYLETDVRKLNQEINARINLYNKLSENYEKLKKTNNILTQDNIKLKNSFSSLMAEYRNFRDLNQSYKIEISELRAENALLSNIKLDPKIEKKIELEPKIEKKIGLEPKIEKKIGLEPKIKKEIEIKSNLDLEINTVPNKNINLVSSEEDDFDDFWLMDKTESPKFNTAYDKLADQLISHEIDYKSTFLAKIEKDIKSFIPAKKEILEAFKKIDYLIIDKEVYNTLEEIIHSDQINKYLNEYLMEVFEPLFDRLNQNITPTMLKNIPKKQFQYLKDFFTILSKKIFKFNINQIKDFYKPKDFKSFQNKYNSFIKMLNKFLKKFQ